MPEVSKAILIADQALEAIEQEARRWPDRETGGILVGYRREGTITVTHATEPGPNAIHAPAAFAKDTPYLQRVLDYLFHYFRVNYLGVWHQHPPDMPYPSQGDLNSAWEDIADPQVPGEDLLIPICTQRAGAVQVIPYLAQRNGYSRVEWQVIPFTGLLNGQWYESPRGKQRAAQEVKALRATGAQVELRRTEDGSYNFYASLPQTQPAAPSPSTLRLRSRQAGAPSETSESARCTGQRRGRSLVFDCAQDYPISPPQIALYNATAGDFSPVDLPGLASWSLDSTLASLYQEWIQSFDQPQP